MNSFIYFYFIIHIDFKTNIRNQTTAIDDVTAGKSRSTEHIYIYGERRYFRFPSSSKNGNRIKESGSNGNFFMSHRYK